MYAVCMRDTLELERLLKEKKNVSHLLNSQCKHNARVLRGLFPYAERALPGKILTLGEQITGNLVNSAAYIMRTDLIFQGVCPPFSVTPCSQTPTTYFEDGRFPHLARDPDIIALGFRLPKEPGLDARGCELARCFCAPSSWMELYDSPQEIGMQEGFVIGDVVAYLLDVRDLVDYTYSDEELGKFDRRARRIAENL